MAFKRMAAAIYRRKISPTEAAIASLYRGLLKREPDPGGLRHFAQKVQNVGHLEPVIDALMRSDEFIRRHGVLPPVSRPDLRPKYPDRYDIRDGQLLFRVGDDHDFDALESAIFAEGYYESMGIYAPRIDRDKRFIASMVTGMGARSCLEIGCFSGPVLSLLHDAGVSVTGLDAAHLAFILAYPNIRSRIKFGDLLSTSFDQKFDTIVAMDVFEHFNPNKFASYIRHAANLLSPGGRIILNSPMYGPDRIFGTVADYEQPEWRETADRAFWRVFPCDELGWPKHGHLIWAAPAWWERQFAEGGLVRDEAAENVLQDVAAPILAENPARKIMFILRRKEDTTAIPLEQFEHQIRLAIA
jgi:hypothetical protein